VNELNNENVNILKILEKNRGRHKTLSRVTWARRARFWDHCFRQCKILENKVTKQFKSQM